MLEIGKDKKNKDDWRSDREFSEYLVSRKNEMCIKCNHSDEFSLYGLIFLSPITVTFIAVMIFH